MTSKITLALSLLLSLSIAGSAQDYTVAYSSSTYEPLVDATLLDENNFTVDANGGEVYQSIPIGFDYTYQGLTYDQLTVGENGYALFLAGNVTESFINIFECPQTNVQGDPLLSPIYYEVSGNPGEQIFKLEFVNVGFDNDQEEDDYINYQLWLYQACDMFEIHIGDASIDPDEFDLFYNNSPSAFMGYGANNPFFFYILGGSPAAPTLQSNASYTLNSVPEEGSIYTFSNCSPNSTQEIEQELINLLPNPVADYIQINFDGANTEDYRVFNLQGKLLTSGLVSSGETIDVSNFAKGNYVLMIPSMEESSIFTIE